MQNRGACPGPELRERRVWMRNIGLNLAKDYAAAMEEAATALVLHTSLVRMEYAGSARISALWRYLLLHTFGAIPWLL